MEQINIYDTQILTWKVNEIFDNLNWEEFPKMKEIVEYICELIEFTPEELYLRHCSYPKNVFYFTQADPCVVYALRKEFKNNKYSENIIDYANKWYKQFSEMNNSFKRNAINHLLSDETSYGIKSENEIFKFYDTPEYKFAFIMDTYVPYLFMKYLSKK